jgi:hypothetical protein
VLRGHPIAELATAAINSRRLIVIAPMLEDGIVSAQEGTLKGPADVRFGSGTSVLAHSG